MDGVAVRAVVVKAEYAKKGLLLTVIFENPAFESESVSTKASDTPLVFSMSYHIMNIFFK